MHFKPSEEITFRVPNQCYAKPDLEPNEVPK
jgi:hypothetical protein